MRRICSTRLGSAPACPEFGLPDGIHYVTSSSDALPAIARALRAAIQAHEPRLSAVRIEPQHAEDGTIHLQITAQVATSSRGRAAIAFRTRLGPGTQLRIEG